MLDYPPRFMAHLLAGCCVVPMPPEAPAAEVNRVRDRTTGVTSEQGCVLMCSSGTTGLPKIVKRSRASLDVVARNMSDAMRMSPGDRVIATVPLVHSYGMEHGLLAPLWAGATVLLCGGLNIQHISTAIRSGATILPAVPSIVELLAESDVLRWHTLRCVYTAGAPLPRGVAERFEKRAGVSVGQVYGLTEVGSVVVNDPARDAPGTVGRACEGVSVRIDPETGEVLVRAGSMLDDYVGDPLDLIDGHFPTGDLGQLTETGELRLTGRLKLLIDVGGAKVNPMEVEQVLLSHPQVAIAVVLPLRVSETVCRVRAVIVPTDRNYPPDVQALRRHAKEQLAGYKVPRLIEIRDTLPRSATGKILRQQLDIA
jgi:acyl-CoA synthetase (AMP-forming)/AMP-acid ligase II